MHLEAPFCLFGSGFRIIITCVINFISVRFSRLRFRLTERAGFELARARDPLEREVAQTCNVGRSMGFAVVLDNVLRN